jgi:hypothetical protein
MGGRRRLRLAVAAILAQVLLPSAFSQETRFSPPEYPSPHSFAPAIGAVPGDPGSTDALFRISREAIYAVYYQIPPQELEVPAKDLAKRSKTEIEATSPVLSRCHPVEVRGDQSKIRCDGWLALIDHGKPGFETSPATEEIVIDFGGSLRPVSTTGSRDKPRLVRFRETSLDELAEDVQRQDAQKFEESFQEQRRQPDQDESEPQRPHIAVIRL